jgi:uronate dehydrogenase
MNRLLITGASGVLGREARAHLSQAAAIIRLSDALPMAPAGAHEEVMQCDLSDAPSVERLCAGVDAILHLGGQAVEAPWERIMQSNITGAINLWEGARKAGVKRILFASSNHAIGFHRRTTTLTHDSPARPDGRYGLSKAFGEDLAYLYAAKFGISAFCIRIGSCFPEPTTERMLSTWLSYADFIRLVEVGLSAAYHYEIVYGVSRNSRTWWDNSNAYRLGYDPRDNAETFASRLGDLPPEDPVSVLFQGGGFTADEFAGDTARIA